MNRLPEFLRVCLNQGRAFGLSIAILSIAYPAPAAEWFNEGKIPHLKIQIAEKEMAILRAYRWEGDKDKTGRTNVSVTVRDGDTIYKNVSLHLKGSAGSFRSIDDRPALTLHFEKDGTGQKFHGLEKIHLNNSIQDPSLICEQLARELFNEAGVPTPRAAHATVEINGRPLGMYVLVEGWNKQFLKRHFPNAKGNLYDGGFGQEINRDVVVNSGEFPDDRSDLQELYKVCRDRDSVHRLAKLSKILDLDRFFTFAAMEILLTHIDGYCMGHNNYRVFHDLSTDRLVFMPHGMDQLFGTFKSTPEYGITPSFKSVVSKGVMEARDGRRQYLNRLTQIYTNAFAGDKLLARVDQIAHSIRPEMKTDLENYLRWSKAVRNLKSRIERRVASVADQLANPPPPLKLDGTNALLVTTWQFHPDNTGQAQGSRGVVEGRPCLNLQGGPGRSTTWGSWRATLLLGEGVYEVQARAHLDPTTLGKQTPIPEIALRQSGDRDGYPKTSGTDWTPLAYRFELVGTTEVELVCELRGPSTKAFIEADSLQLRRIGPNTVQ